MTLEQIQQIIVDAELQTLLRQMITALTERVRQRHKQEDLERRERKRYKWRCW
jgi:hypothetical protein